MKRTKTPEQCCKECEQHYYTRCRTYVDYHLTSPDIWEWRKGWWVELERWKLEVECDRHKQEN